MCTACAYDHSAALSCPEQLAEYLQLTYLFRELDDEQLDAVVASLRTVELKDGRWLFRQGEPAERFFLVREGKVALFRQSAEGRETVIAVVGADEMFGEELLCLADAHYDLNARAVGDSTLLGIDRLGFRAFLRDSVALNLRIQETLYRRQTMLLDHIERLTLQDATQRVMAYLLVQAGTVQGARRVELSMPKSTLAAHLSIQPETLSRVLARLKDCNYLREEDGELVIRTAEMRAGLECSLCPNRWGCPGPDHLPFVGATT